MTSRKALLEPGQFGLRIAPAVIQTSVLDNGHSGMPINTFVCPATTIGNLLIYLGFKRQFACPTMTTDTWTTLETKQFQRTTTTDENGLVAQALQVLTSRTSYSMSGQISGGVLYEISHAQLANLTHNGLSDQASSTNLDYGNLGVIDQSQMVLGVHGFGPDNLTVTVTPSGYTRDYYGGNSGNSGGTNSVFSDFPYAYFAHRQGAGAPVSHKIALDSSQKWGDIWVVVT